MTPVLFGRWQSRIFLLSTVGILVSLLVNLVLQTDIMILLIILVYVLLFGLVWDILYTVIQSVRWDRDWPPAFVIFAGVVEAVFLWIILNSANSIPGLPAIPPLGSFVFHYTSVWLATFIMLFGPMRILFHRWRWYGGRIV